jgi:hypothetical protein
MCLLLLCYRRAKGWTRARVFESHGKCHCRFGARSDFGVFREKHRRTQSKFGQKQTILLLISYFNWYSHKIYMMLNKPFDKY